MFSSSLKLGKMKNKIFKQILRFNIFYFFLGKYYFKKYSFHKIKTSSIDTGWGVLTSNYKIRIPINNLLALLHTNKGYSYKNIENTPHFNLILNYHKNHQITPNEYLSYIKTYEKNLDANEKLEEFINLFNEIKENQNQLTVATKKEAASFKNNKFKILDGLHRASIAKVLSINEIDCFIVDEINK